MCDDPRPVFNIVFMTFAQSVLSHEKELIEQFRTLVSVSMQDEKLQIFVEILIKSLTRFSERNVPKLPSGGEVAPLDKKTVRKFLFEAQRLGHEMRKSEDYEMLPIWKMSMWLGLQNDDGLRQEFAERCLIDGEPADQIVAGREIIWDALSYRKRIAVRADSTQIDQ